MSTTVDDQDTDAKELQAEIKRLKAENAQLAKERDASQRERDALERERDKLAEDVKEVRHEARDRRHEMKAAVEEWKEKLAALEGDRDTLADELRDALADRDQWKTKYEAEPNELQARLDRATGELREFKHGKVFEQVARAHQVVDPLKIEDLRKVTGYRPETDDVDEAKLGSIIGDALKGRPWLVEKETKAGADDPPATDRAAADAASKAAPTTKDAPGGAKDSSPAAIAGPAAAGSPGNGTPAPGQGPSKPGPGFDRGGSVAREIPGFPALKPGQIPGRL